MKKLMKITILFCFGTLFMLAFIQSSTGATTQGDTTFGVDRLDEYNWKITAGAPEVIGYKYKIKIENIFVGGGVYQPNVHCCLLDVTMEFYNATDATWDTLINNSRYIAANETEDYIYFRDFDHVGVFFFIPTPINLTMLGEYALSLPAYFSYSVSGNSITMESFFGDYILTFNSNGVMTKMIATAFGISAAELTLVTGDAPAISFGFYYLFFTLIGIIGLVYLKKRKIN
ncbi:MAG: hypothetical protein CEE43_17225 [Promethearchaeota archaeon Loki_b32]|nr:MAG: hypothetical protein CEE43_17225 [Candidatus Lokiarchaeota archaeon Loki_b32]